MTAAGSKHLPPETLKAYGQGRLDASAAAGVEQHLLGCAICCEALKAVPPDPFIDLLRETQPGAERRAAVSERPSSPAPPARRAGGWLPWVLALVGLLVLVGVAVLVLKLW